ncbi:2-hydroxy-3-oxopropionate reductase [Clostridia bacterium]|nr:2-hydroxy-3-oxopropionate reductase [Clostridia bacterium]
MNKIGFIGLGNMGGEIAKAIAAKAYSLVVFDVCKDVVSGFRDIAEVADNALDVCRKSDVVFLSLPSSRIVEPIVESFLADGVQDKIIADLSTSDPDSTKKLFQKVLLAGGHLADCPISGMPNQASQGKLMSMFGGESGIHDQLAPLVQCFADRFPNMGSIGNGHLTKLIFNYIALSYVNIYAMTFSLSGQEGLDNQQLFELLKTTAMNCGTMNFYVPKMIDKTYDMAFSLELAHKDLSCVKGLFEKYQVPAYALDGTLELLRTSIRDGHGKEDYSTCIDTMYSFFEHKERI